MVSLFSLSLRSKKTCAQTPPDFLYDLAFLVACCNIDFKVGRGMTKRKEKKRN